MAMKYSLTIFKTLFDNKTHKLMNFESWEELESLFYKLSEVERASKKDAELISPATFIDQTTRANKNVVDWGGWCAVDVDDHEFKGDLKSELDGLVGNYYYLCYSTASSRRDSPKFRLVFPLRVRVTQKDIKAFWYALQSKLGNIGDRQTKDLSRMYYIPGQYHDAYNFIFTGGGNQFIDPYELMREFPYQEKQGNSFIDRLPDELQKQVIEYRKQKLDNHNYKWNSYKDCPFFPRHLEKEYMSITGTGWYRSMYRIMVSIASNAIKKEYPITSQEIATLCKEFDMATGNWYENRPMQREADNALEFVYKNL